MKKYLLVIPLFVLAVGSITVLGCQWLAILTQNSYSIIQLDPLQEDNVEVLYMNNTTTFATDNTADTSDFLVEEDNNESESGSSSSLTCTTDNGEFTVTSDETLWEQYTSVNIFNGLEIVAPGDHGEFSFTLTNDKASDIEYYMIIEKFEDENLQIPLTFRLKTAEGNYIGSDEWISGDELEEIYETVRSGNYYTYILEWQWDAYVDDEYDTLLGTSERLEYTMTITIIASGDCEDMYAPKTGDDSNWVPLIAILFVSALMIILIIAWRKKRDKNEE